MVWRMDEGGKYKDKDADRVVRDELARVGAIRWLCAVQMRLFHPSHSRKRPTSGQMLDKPKSLCIVWPNDSGITCSGWRREKTMALK